MRANLMIGLKEIIVHGIKALIKPGAIIKEMIP